MMMTGPREMGGMAALEQTNQLLASFVVVQGIRDDLG